MATAASSGFNPTRHLSATALAVTGCGPYLADLPAGGSAITPVWKLPTAGGGTTSTVEAISRMRLWPTVADVEGNATASRVAPIVKPSYGFTLMMFRRSEFRVICLSLLIGLPALGFSADLRITGVDRERFISWTNALVPGVCTIETADAVDGSWRPARNLFTTNSAGNTAVTAVNRTAFYRLRMVDVSGTPQGFTNLVYSYGQLETLAGTGVGQTDGVSYWQTSYENGLAKEAALSRPHFAQADRAGNIYIADKNSHSILRITPEGTIHTFAGTHEGGFSGEGPDHATDLQLSFPNGAWVRADGTVYVLDTGNGRVCRIDRNGVMQTLFRATNDGSPVSGGRGLWVNEAETLAYFCAGTRLRRWTPSAGVKTVAGEFIELGTLFVEPSGDILVCDRGAHLVYRVKNSGARTVIAGNGQTTGGGDGFPALETGLDGVRSVWPLPTGGLLLLTHDGCQLWYMDTSGVIRLLLNGAAGRTHSGDGWFFYTPSPAISEGRSVTVDFDGNILVTESDWGYVRRIRFCPVPQW